MHTFHTRRLGDSLHAYAVMSVLAEQGEATTFHAYTPFAELFAGGRLQVLASNRGTQWNAISPGVFKGPEHSHHVRDSMARAAGVRGGVNLELSLPRPARSDRPYVVVCPDAGAPYKEWPRKRWGPLIEYVLCEDHDVVICGLPGRARIPAPARARHASLGPMPFARTVAGAQAVIGPDSGHIHLADALGVPAVGLYAATSTITYGPYRDRRWCVDRHLAAFATQMPYDTARHVLTKVMEIVTVDEVRNVLARLFHTQRLQCAAHRFAPVGTP